MKIAFDMKSIDKLKQILLQLRQAEMAGSLKEAYYSQFGDANFTDILLVALELINGDYGITIEDIKRLQDFDTRLRITKTFAADHPMTIFKQENMAFRTVLDNIHQLLEMLETEELESQVFRLGEFHKHFNRKEKLFFPIMEKYGHYTLTRVIWRRDDRIRQLFKTLKRQIELLPGSDINRVQQTFRTFQGEFLSMIFVEEAIVLPIAQAIFNEDEWKAIAMESDAFGYALVEEPIVEKAQRVGNNVCNKENHPFGGGYLTLEEANLILNHLPLEITFIDKNSIFKYFNKMTKNPADMMLVRTESSIGRNVANCHPPKSLKKVMTLIRDLKTGKRASESMWFKKGDHYIHLTYQAIFNEAGEYLGILEYVQDMQPFFNLPQEAKTGLKRIEE